MRSTDECEMSRSCHSATSCSPASRFDRTTTGEAADRLGRDRVALVRHRRRALLPGLEPLAHLARPRCVAGGAARRRSARTSPPIDAQRPEQLGVAVAGDHLRRRHRRQAEGVADVALDRRIDVGVGADRARRACTPTRLAAPRRAGRGRGRAAAPTARPWRRTWSVRRGCRGCGRSSPCRGGRGRAPTTRGDQRRSTPSTSRSAGVAHRPAQRGVDDVGRRQPVVDPRAGGHADGRLHDVDERGDVVVGDALALEHRLRRTPRRPPARARGRPRRRPPARPRGRRAPRWPAARPRASGRSGPRRTTPSAISGRRVARDH